MLAYYVGLVEETDEPASFSQDEGHHKHKDVLKGE